MFDDLLKDHFGISPLDLFEVRGGFSAKAYRVNTAEKSYFLKVYDKSLPTVQPWIKRIDDYMPVLSWLSEASELSARIIKPIKTVNDKLKVETDDNVFLLFDYVEGATPNKEGLTRSQVVELAETMAILHNTGKTIPFETPGLNEDVSLHFCKELEHFLDNIGDASEALVNIVSPHADMLRAAIKRTLHIRDTVRLDYSALVLCHGDAHSNNVILGDHLVLVDWEDLRWAPVEADLFIYAWHPHGDALLKAYAAAQNGYRINQELLSFYLLRRRIEDVWVDVQRLTEECPDEAETAKLLDFTRRGIDEVAALQNKGRP